MVIVDKGFISQKFKQALILESGFDPKSISIDETGPQSAQFSAPEGELFSLSFQISMVERIPPIVTVWTQSWTLDTVSLSKKVEELYPGEIKIIVN